MQSVSHGHTLAHVYYVHCRILLNESTQTRRYIILSVHDHSFCVMQYFYLVIMCFQCRTRAADKFLKNAPLLLSGKTIKLRLACIWVKCGFSSAATSAFYTFKIRRSADPHFTPGHSRTRTGHLADWSTLGLDNSRTGQVADWTTRGCHRQLCVLSFRSFGGICETANCPVCEMSSPRVGNPRVGVSASCPVTPKESARRYLL